MLSSLLDFLPPPPPVVVVVVVLVVEADVVAPVVDVDNKLVVVAVVTEADVVVPVGDTKVSASGGVIWKQYWWARERVDF